MNLRLPASSKCLQRGIRWKTMALLPLLLLMSASNAPAGSYTDSAHGSSGNGVLRTATGGTPPSGFGYARGNCAHCHEQHASIEGGEPAPVTGPAPYALFAPFFDTAQQTHLYSEDDDFCFYCHNSSGSAQQVTNYTYSQNFGCGSLGPTSILEAMNQNSYHNLYDIYTFAKNKFSSWFKNQSNPCSVCHNPHLARRNWANPQDPAFSAIVKPSDHFTLWGTTQTMDTSYNTKYEPPLCSSTGNDREPAGSSDAAAGRANTPDYVAFCTECHNNTNTIYSTTLNTNVRAIDWSATGDKHGVGIMDVEIGTKEPYTRLSGDYVLSCADCHEPHGSENVLLIRPRVNGGELGETIDTFDTSELGYLCKRCHNDDQDLGGGTANKWGFVHHSDLLNPNPDAPYTNLLGVDCTICHDGAGGTNCQNCHYHGAEIPITVGDNTGQTRRTF